LPARLFRWNARLFGIVVSVLNEIIESEARRAGFAAVGFAAARRLEERREFYQGWLDSGRHADMEYLAREPARRLDPRSLDARFRSVISLGYPYAAPAAPQRDWRAELRGRIAAYALGRDYHDHVLRAARSVAAALEAHRPGTVTRAYVDTGPVFEREWGTQARLGWMGKNTMLLSRERGSYFFLAEIFTDAVLEPTAAPYREHCGTCRRCLDLCPTDALADRFLIEPRVCISYLTIENRGAIARELRPKLDNWIFGCDICQEVCPWNDSGARHEPDLAPYLPDLLALDNDGFARRFTRSAIKRAKRRGLLRNAAVVLGNTGNREAVRPLARTLGSEHEPLVRAHAAWALGRLGGAEARRALEDARARETDAAACEEIALALDEIAP
jgi:epoxyqueuosine reductase